MTTKKRINRQKLFLDFLAGKYEVRCDGKYTDDYAYDSSVNFQEEKEFTTPKNKFDLYENITNGYVGLEENGDYSVSYASAYYHTLRPVKSTAKPSLCDSVIIELLQDCKKAMKYVSSNDIIRAGLVLSMAYFDTQSFYDILKNTNRYNDTEKSLQDFKDTYSFLDFHKYFNIFLKLSFDETINLFIAIMPCYSHELENYRSMVNNREVEELNEVIIIDEIKETAIDTLIESIAVQPETKSNIIEFKKKDINLSFNLDSIINDLENISSSDTPIIKNYPDKLYDIGAYS